jgi:hypothetical protein
VPLSQTVIFIVVLSTSPGMTFAPSYIVQVRGSGKLRLTVVSVLWFVLSVVFASHSLIEDGMEHVGDVIGGLRGMRVE